MEVSVNVLMLCMEKLTCGLCETYHKHDRPHSIPLPVRNSHSNVWKIPTDNIELCLPFGMYNLSKRKHISVGVVTLHNMEHTECIRKPGLTGGNGSERRMGETKETWILIFFRGLSRTDILWEKSGRSRLDASTMFYCETQQISSIYAFHVESWSSQIGHQILYIKSWALIWIGMLVEFVKKINLDVSDEKWFPLLKLPKIDMCSRINFPC